MKDVSQTANPVSLFASTSSSQPPVRIATPHPPKSPLSEPALLAGGTDPPTTLPLPKTLMPQPIAPGIVLGRHAHIGDEDTSAAEVGAKKRGGGDGGAQGEQKETEGEHKETKSEHKEKGEHNKEEEPKQTKEEQKKTEEEQKKTEEEQKKTEEEQKKTEEEQKKTEEEQKKTEEHEE
ncbi:hypothetical protein PMIN03_011666 [Paraphaeosphaeria minitans]